MERRKVSSRFHWNIASDFIILLLSISCGNGEPDRSSSSSSFTYSSYNQAVTCTASSPPQWPTTIQELQRLVDHARANNTRLKPLGNLHTWTDMICTDGTPLFMRRINHIRYDLWTKSVRVGAGAIVADVVEQLHRVGRTLDGIPTYGNVTIGGVISAGIHSSNLNNAPATLSDIVVAVVLVDGLGQVRNVTDPRLLQALRSHLGLLGILYEVTLRTIPQYKVHVRNFPAPDSLLVEGTDKILNLATSSNAFHLWWIPTGKQVVLSVATKVPLSTPGNCATGFISESPRNLTESTAAAIETMQAGRDHLGLFVLQGVAEMSLYQAVLGRSPIYSEDGKLLCTPAIGFNHRMKSNLCRECAWWHGNSSIYPYDIEVVVPLTEFGPAVATMRSIFNEYPVEFPVVGIFIRFVTGSDALLAVSSGRDSVAFEFAEVARKDRYSQPMMGIGGIQAVVQALIRRHSGRPHWTKVGLHYLNPSLLPKYYDTIPQFVRVMEEFDPKGVFLNDFGKRLRYRVASPPRDSRVKHCALLDHCICERDRDCGDGSADSLICGQLEGYRVCRENWDMEDKNRVLRKVINIVKP